jgi:hypothetical protein
VHVCTSQSPVLFIIIIIITITIIMTIIIIIITIIMTIIIIIVITVTIIMIMIIIIVVVVALGLTMHATWTPLSNPAYYRDYLRLDLVLNAQQMKSAAAGLPQHDEHLFIVIHQSA